jgi:hypothetical protein
MGYKIAFKEHGVKPTQTPYFGSILAFLKAKSKGHLAGKYGAPTGRRATDRRKKKGAKIFF